MKAEFVEIPRETTSHAHFLVAGRFDFLVTSSEHTTTLELRLQYDRPSFVTVRYPTQSTQRDPINRFSTKCGVLAEFTRALEAYFNFNNTADMYMSSETNVVRHRQKGVPVAVAYVNDMLKVAISCTALTPGPVGLHARIALIGAWDRSRKPVSEEFAAQLVEVL